MACQMRARWGEWVRHGSSGGYETAITALWSHLLPMANSTTAASEIASLLTLTLPVPSNRQRSVTSPTSSCHPPD